ncbi:PASTA domain-containing protein [Streptomyces sp. NPDC050704]|uniref:PASTA domain-containing protein n=1 Tax=Streptomyces sp. NPDC050704 TaxID=3157219 RepID=UPI00341396FC
MNDFVNASDAPAFDTAGIVRRTRRKRTAAMAGLAAAALIVIGGGTALATAGGSGSNASEPAAATTAPTDDDVNISMEGSQFKIELTGLDLDLAQQQLLRAQLKIGTVSETPCGKHGKPGSVIAVEPHSPETASKGDTINLTLCAD